MKGQRQQLGIVAFGICALFIGGIVIIALIAAKKSTVAEKKVELKVAQQALQKRPVGNDVEGPRRKEIAPAADPIASRPAIPDIRLPNPVPNEPVRVNLPKPVPKAAPKHEPKEPTAVEVEPQPKAEPEPAQLKDAERIDPKLIELAKGIRAKTAKERIKALNDVAALGEEAQPIARTIILGVMDSIPEVRKAALAALKAVRPDLHQHVLIYVVDESLREKCHAIQGMGRLGESAKPVIPLLLPILQNPQQANFSLVMATIPALRSIAPDYEVAMTPLLQLLNYNHKYVQDEALQSLLALVRAKPETLNRLIAALIACVKNADHNLRIDAMRTLGSFGPAAKAALPVLKQLEFHPDRDIRDPAVYAMAKINANP